MKRKGFLEGNAAVWMISVSSFKGLCDHYMYQIGYQRSKTDIGKKMICHMDPVIAKNDHIDAGCSKTDHIFLWTVLSETICEHRQGKHHRSNCHVAAWPALEIVIASCKIRHKMPPVSIFAVRVIQS